jgi:predicted dehydrogenase
VLGDKSIEAVILVLPITVQPDMIRRAWRAGKHVLSEKPLGRDVAEGKALIREYENEWKPNGLIWRVAESKYC